MSPETEKLLEAALKLPPDARAALAGQLIDSLDDEVDVEAEGLWQAEIARRARQLDSASMGTVPWPEVRRKILGGQ